LWEQPGSHTEADAAQVRFQKMKDREERKKKIKLEEVGAKEENRGRTNLQSANFINSSKLFIM